jgi:Tfp pilus tip-associated adhesin PilY1
MKMSQRNSKLSKPGQGQHKQPDDLPLMNNPPTNPFLYSLQNMGWDLDDDIDIIEDKDNNRIILTNNTRNPPK